MKISIITVTYNSAKFISSCIESIISQTYNNIEYIIIDGGSTDGTLNAIKEHGQIKYISEPDNGIYDAMNKGINMATGDVIGILNSDDIYQDNEVLSDIMQCFADQPDLDIVYGNLVYVKNADTSKVVRKWSSAAYYNDFFEHGHVPPHPALFLRAEVYKKAGLFNLDYRLAADYEFMLRIFKKYNFKSKYINRLVVRMRLGGATNKNIKNIIGGNTEILRSWKANGLKIPFLLIFRRFFKRLIQFI